MCNSELGLATISYSGLCIARNTISFPTNCVYLSTEGESNNNSVDCPLITVQIAARWLLQIALHGCMAAVWFDIVFINNDEHVVSHVNKTTLNAVEWCVRHIVTHCSSLVLQKTNAREKPEGTHRVRTHAILLLSVNPNPNVDLWPFNPKPCHF